MLSKYQVIEITADGSSSYHWRSQSETKKNLKFHICNSYILPKIFMLIKSRIYDGLDI